MEIGLEASSVQKTMFATAASHLLCSEVLHNGDIETFILIRARACTGLDSGTCFNALDQSHIRLPNSFQEFLRV